MDKTDQFNAALLLLRVVPGVTMALHGLNKAKSLASTGGWFESLGMKPGALHARMACGTEIGSGALLALGLLTPFAGAAFVALMVVAAWTAHRKNGFFIFNAGGGWEYTLILATIGAAIGGLGAGKWSLDDSLDWTYGKWGLIISLVGGVAAGLAQLIVFYRPAPTAK
jgi:putative oxidoreductase